MKKFNLSGIAIDYNDEYISAPFFEAITKHVQGYEEKYEPEKAIKVDQLIPKNFNSENEDSLKELFMNTIQSLKSESEIFRDIEDEDLSIGAEDFVYTMNQPANIDAYEKGDFHIKTLNKSEEESRVIYKLGNEIILSYDKNISKELSSATDIVLKSVIVLVDIIFLLMTLANLSVQVSSEKLKKIFKYVTKFNNFIAKVTKTVGEKIALICKSMTAGEVVAIIIPLFSSLLTNKNELYEFFKGLFKLIFKMKWYEIALTAAKFIASIVAYIFTAGVKLIATIAKAVLQLASMINDLIKLVSAIKDKEVPLNKV